MHPDEPPESSRDPLALFGLFFYPPGAGFVLVLAFGNPAVALIGMFAAAYGSALFVFRRTPTGGFAHGKAIATAIAVLLGWAALAFAILIAMCGGFRG